MQMKIQAALVASFLIASSLVGPVAYTENHEPLLYIKNPEPGLQDSFGWSVAKIGGDIVVGVPFDDPNGKTDAGSVYVFDGRTGELRLTIPNPDPGSTGDLGDEFGYSIAAAGKNILVGARGDGASDGGIVYLFDQKTGVLLLTISNPEPGGPSEGIGGDQFGASVAKLGSEILVGAYIDDHVGGPVDAGSVYLFDGEDGTLIDTIRADDATAEDLFGFRIVVVAENIAISAYRDDEGAGNSGSVYLFDRETLNFVVKIPNPDPAGGDQFGLSMAAQGGTLVVGAQLDDPNGKTDAGSVYVFDGRTGELRLTIPNPDAENGTSLGQQFGSSVAFGFGTIIVGARGDDGAGVDTGTVYLFDQVTGELLRTIPNPDPNTVGQDRFGQAVATSRGNIVIGTIFDDEGATHAGSVSVFAEAK